MYESFLGYLLLRVYLLHYALYVLLGREKTQKNMDFRAWSAISLGDFYCGNENMGACADEYRFMVYVLAEP